MIDLHCHILPALDDGALDLADSLGMARQAEQDGVTVVCATPHIRADHAIDIGSISSRVGDLQRAIELQGTGVRVLPGGEVGQAEASALSDAQLAAVALGGKGRWLLLEPAPGPLGTGLEDLATALAERGFRSVIAHPERHAGADFAERLERLAGLGCLIQWTAEFLAGAREGDITIDLARRGLVHLLGSDAHSSRAGRPLRLAAGYARLAAVRSPPQLEWSARLAPLAIVEGGELTQSP
jgi:protein-tyrosine phosphatase